MYFYKIKKVYFIFFHKIFFIIVLYSFSKSWSQNHEIFLLSLSGFCSLFQFSEMSSVEKENEQPQLDSAQKSEEENGLQELGGLQMPKKQVEMSENADEEKEDASRQQEPTRTASQAAVRQDLHLQANGSQGDRDSDALRLANIDTFFFIYKTRKKYTSINKSVIIYKFDYFTDNFLKNK